MQADTVLHGGRVYTPAALRAMRRDAEPALHLPPAPDSLAIADGRIVGLGELDDGSHHGLTAAMAALVGSDTRVIDLRRCAVVAGFVDAHIHFGSFALSRREVDLNGAATLEDGLQLLRTTAAAVPRTKWLRGRGWDRNRWRRLPTAAELDAVVGNRPAVLASHDGHSVWLSSAALRATGIDRHTPDPPGGVIDRDSSGEPSGVVFETAQELIQHHIPRPTHDELTDALKQALPVAAAAGITGIHNMEGAHSRAAFEALERAQELTLRVFHGVARGELQDARLRGLRTGAGSDLLRTGPLKLFADGALGSRTAYLLEPYAGRNDNYRGVATLQPEEIEDALRMAADAELDCAIHAIGDAAIRGVLDTYERTLHSAPALVQRQLRIEHAQLVDPLDVPRFAKLNVIASMQPIHAAADWHAADAHWGTRARHSYGWRALLDAGATLAFGTDAPVERIEPMLSMHAAITRTDLNGEPVGGWYPAQRISLAEALYAYTVGSALAGRAMDRRGSIEIGKDADLVVLEPDPFSVAREAVRDTRVVLTMVGGRIVFEGAINE